MRYDGQVVGQGSFALCIERIDLGSPQQDYGKKVEEEDENNGKANGSGIAT